MGSVRRRTVSVREVVSNYIGGGWGKDVPDDDHASPAWVIRGRDLAAVRVGDTSSCPLRYHKESNLRSRDLVPWDIVFEVSGGSKDQPVGRSLLVTSATRARFDGGVMCASFCKRARPNRSVIDPAFLYWTLQALYNDRSILQYQVQSTGISNFKFEAFLDGQQIWLPSLDDQRRISGALCAYDALIENNTRRIRILEGMAQAIYREWFVEFRYPGHEDTPRVDSDLGRIPDGWSVCEVKELVKRLRPGRTYQEADVQVSGSIPVVDQSRSGLMGFHEQAPDFRASLTKPILVFGDHTCRMEVMTEAFSVGPNVVPFQPAGDCSPAHLFELVRGLVATTEYKRHWSDLMAKRVISPPAELTHEYARRANDLIGLRRVLLAQSRVLGRCRDELLPRLISGEIDVSDLDMPEVA